jgi:endonuclease YncB( thermonuclease family)
MAVIRQGDRVEVWFEDKKQMGTIVGRCTLRGGSKGYAILLDMGKYTAVAESDIKVGP